MNKEKAEKYIKLFNEYVKDVKNEEYFLSNTFKKYLKANRILNKDDINYKIMKYFLGIFKNISSNSNTLIKNIDGCDITLGSYGFGARINNYKQAIPIIYYDRLKYIVDRKDKIIEALESKRKWVKADELKKFLEIIKKLDNINNTINIKLQNPITTLNIHNISYNNSEYVNVKYDSVRIIPENNIYIRLIDAKNIGDELEIHNKCDNIEHDFLRYFHNIIPNYLLKDQEEYLLEEFKKQIEYNNTIQTEVLLELDKEFGKYLMANSL